MGTKSRNQVTSTGFDANSQAYIDKTRNAATQAANALTQTGPYSGQRAADASGYEQAGAQQLGAYGQAGQGAIGQLQGAAGVAGFGIPAWMQAMNAGQSGFGVTQDAQNGFGAGQAAMAGQAMRGQNASQNLGVAAQAGNGAIGNYAGLADKSNDVFNAYGDQAGLAKQGIGGLQQALQQAGYGAQAANMALAGGPNTGAFFDPYQAQVIGGVRDQFDQSREKLNRDISSNATKAGAFGGSREAVTRGAALADLARSESSQIANLMSSGYQNAQNAAQQDQQFRFGAGMQQQNLGFGAANNLLNYGQQGQDARAGMVNNATGQLANLGFNANQFLSGQGANAAGNLYSGGLNAAQFAAGQGQAAAGNINQYGMNAANSLFGTGFSAANGQLGAGQQLRGVNQNQLDAQYQAFHEPFQRQQQALGLMQQGLGPMGTTQTTPQRRNVGSGILGGALSGFSAGGPWGALAGGVLGGIG